ncbi:TetR/AcrR family transcriptional regulator [Bacteroides salyersiae]|nr:TetR/AcrR family transcriptional regulator [Bacteroides salyersiae]
MQKLKSDIQKTILDAAEYLFIRKGYKNTAMREIAAKADVGLSNIYNYFPNKDSLFRYILQPVVDEALYHALQPRRKQSKSRNVHQP